MVVDVLRDRWHYACMAVLRSNPLSPSELLNAFHAAAEDAAQVLGTHNVYPERVTRHLSVLTAAGLVKPGCVRGRLRTYSTTPLGADLLDSLDAAAHYGWHRYGWLVRCTRAERHIDLNAPLPAPDPADSDDMVRQRLLRRTVVMLFGTVLAPKWSFATLAALTGAPLRPYRILAVVNGAVGASPDVVSGHLATPMLNTRLDRLQQLGLVVCIDSEMDRRTSYALTDDGHALMESLEPVAVFGMRRDREMTAAIKAM